MSLVPRALCDLNCGKKPLLSRCQLPWPFDGRFSLENHSIIQKREFWDEVLNDFM